MRQSLSLLFVLFTFAMQASYGQSIIANPKSSAITAQKISGVELAIPIEVDVAKVTAGKVTANIIVQIDNKPAPVISRFNEADIANGRIKIINHSQSISLDTNDTKTTLKTVYFFIDSSIAIKNQKIIYLTINGDGRVLSNIKLTIQPNDNVLELDEYMEHYKKKKDKVNQLDHVTKVVSDNNIMKVYGYKIIREADGKGYDAFLMRTVELKREEVFAVIEPSTIFDWYHWRPVPISLITVPFKVRPSITSNGRKFSATSSSGISNLGFNFDLAKRQTDRYFSTGKKVTHKVSLGVWGAPSVEELDSIYTHGADGLLGKAAGKIEKSKQLFISTGITISYSYNQLSFVLVPAGWDLATSKIGKAWVYNKKFWWGFGIAISPQIFAAIFSKT